MGRRTNMKKLISTYAAMRTHLNIIVITVFVRNGKTPMWEYNLVF